MTINTEMHGAKIHARNIAGQGSLIFFYHAQVVNRGLPTHLMFDLSTNPQHMRNNGLPDALIFLSTVTISNIILHYTSWLDHAGKIRVRNPSSRTMEYCASVNAFAISSLTRPPSLDAWWEKTSSWFCPSSFNIGKCIQLIYSPVQGLSVF